MFLSQPRQELAYACRNCSDASIRAIERSRGRARTQNQFRRRDTLAYDQEVDRRMALPDPPPWSVLQDAEFPQGYPDGCELVSRRCIEPHCATRLIPGKGSKRTSTPIGFLKNSQQQSVADNKKGPYEKSFCKRCVRYWGAGYRTIGFGTKRG